MPRVLLIVPSTTYRAGDFMDAAAKIGAEVVVATDDQSPMSSVSGSRMLQIPLDDATAACRRIVEHDATTPIDAIVAVDDQGCVIAAMAGEELGLPHNPPDAAAAARDKSLLRERLAANEVPQPSFMRVGPDTDDEEATHRLIAFGFPCVIKPTTLSGSQGVIRANDVNSALSAIHLARSIACSEPQSDGVLLVERYVGGEEIALEGLLTDGELDVLAVFDKPEPLVGPYFEETIYVTPSRLSPRDENAVVDTTRAAVHALGLQTGPVHAELRVENGRAQVLEIAARTIGGLCARALRFATGKTLEEIVLANALGRGLPGATSRERAAAGILMIPIPLSGTLQGIDGIDETLELRGITSVDITVPVGRKVTALPEGNRYLGFVFAKGESPEEVTKTLVQARSNLRVRIHP